MDGLAPVRIVGLVAGDLEVSPCARGMIPAKDGAFRLPRGALPIGRRIARSFGEVAVEKDVALSARMPATASAPQTKRRKRDRERYSNAASPKM